MGTLKGQTVDNSGMGSRRSPKYRTLASLSRIKLLSQLQQRGTMTVADLAEAAGLHHNTAREHLHRLIADGFVSSEAEPRDTKGRPRMLYSAAVEPDLREGSIRAANVAAGLRRAEEFRRVLPMAGGAGGQTPASRQLDALEDHLDRSGFGSTIEADGLHIHLHDCPFATMVEEDPTVCRVHFGLVQSLLSQAGGPLEASRIHPLIEANRCTLDLHCPEPRPGR